MFHHDGISSDARLVRELRCLLSEENNKREALIGCLDAAQLRQRCITREVAAYLAKETGASLAEVYGVATFYHMLTEMPLGKSIIRVCDCLTCHVRGGPAVLEALKEELGLEVGATTRNGRVSLLESPCMGLCDIAPAIMINGRAYGNLSPKRAREIARAVRIGIPAWAIASKRPYKHGQGSKVVS